MVVDSRKGHESKSRKCRARGRSKTGRARSRLQSERTSGRSLLRRPRRLRTRQYLLRRARPVAAAAAALRCCQPRAHGLPRTGVLPAEPRQRVQELIGRHLPGRARGSSQVGHVQLDWQRQPLGWASCLQERRLKGVSPQGLMHRPASGAGLDLLAANPSRS